MKVPDKIWPESRRRTVSRARLPDALHDPAMHLASSSHGLIHRTEVATTVAQVLSRPIPGPISTSAMLHPFGRSRRSWFCTFLVPMPCCHALRYLSAGSLAASRRRTDRHSGSVADNAEFSVAILDMRRRRLQQVRGDLLALGLS